MREIVDVHYPGITQDLVQEAMEVFFDVRSIPGLKKKPSTSELIDWLKLLMADDIPDEILKERDPTKAIPAAVRRAAEERAGRAPAGAPGLHAPARDASRPGPEAPMLINFFHGLRDAGVPVTTTELLDLLEGLKAARRLRRHGRVLLLLPHLHGQGREVLRSLRPRLRPALPGAGRTLDDIIEALIPDDWLRSEFMKNLSEEDKAKIESLGGLEKLIEEFKKRLEEQKERHEGGNKWIGTGGTSPFGQEGYHPEGIRVGPNGKNKKAVKVWEKRDFKNLDDSVELGTRNIKIALRRLRKFARTGAADELDLDDTISSTARNAGLLDIKMVPERHNAVKVLLFLDVGGSMDPHVKVCEELFSAARTEFKHLEYFYFHNFIYESVWKNNMRRHNERTPCWTCCTSTATTTRWSLSATPPCHPTRSPSPAAAWSTGTRSPGEVWMRRLH